MTGWRARVVLGLLGAFVIASVADGRYLLYVRPGMKAVLIVTGAVLVLLAVHGALREWRQHDRAGLGTGGHAEHSGSEQGHRDGHLHGRAGTAWLLLAPVACSALLAPPALGSYSAARATDAAATRPAGPDPATGSGGDVAWPPLPPGDVVPLTLGDFITRARWDPGASLAGRTVRLTGFVVPAQEERAGGSGWTLARMAIMCCAADAAVYRVRVEDIPAGTGAGGTGAAGTGAGEVAVPVADTWLEVEGDWIPEPADAAGQAADDRPPRLRLIRMRRIDTPTVPYE